MKILRKDSHPIKTKLLTKAVNSAVEFGRIKCLVKGIFMALLHKKSGAEQEIKSDEKASKKSKKAKKKQQTETLSSVWWEKCKSLSKEQKAAAEDFFAHVNIAYDVGRIDVRGDNLYYLPEPQYDGRGLHFLRNGLFMGELQKKI